MYQVAAALKTFLSGFEMPAFQEDSVPDDIQLPYITYSLSEPEWNQKASMIVQVWDRTKSNERIIRTADQITQAIGERCDLELDGGYLVIWPETPLIQTKVDGGVRQALINLSINAYHMPGV